jgi:thiol:disulfide interchange protein DsbA
MSANEIQVKISAQLDDLIAGFAEAQSTVSDALNAINEKIAEVSDSLDAKLGEGAEAAKKHLADVSESTASVGPDKVEVVEVFWYGCPHCFDLEPYIQSWLKKKPANVEFVRIPVMWGPVHRAHAHLYYTLQALQRSDLDNKVFETIHNDHNMLVANSDPETLNEQAPWAAAHGINADAFKTAYNSFTVSSNLARAEELTTRYHVEGVPLIIVNGKYATDVGKAGGPTELMAEISDLVASEKHH